MTKNEQQLAILQELVERHQLVQGNPCPTCLCELYRTNMYQWSLPVCVRCYPPRGYHINACVELAHPSFW
ncbi:MAG: hypothetical protein E6J04_19175 [Chloroflexi bacterium]|nr:MAG: hypothetical protein E6J22_20405 [Chloroflexota bacterium]TMC90151.1 MAG: hypothetical protein E6J11_21835 [Chloroflexota bacterium]TMD25577.1 MAG: hypothetical protein E6J04_19175 [Chloroflexota bacterium]